MLVCPSCAGELRFDIPSQQMKCGSCGNLTDPFDYDPNKVDGRQENVFDATIYSCPQCGGEIFSNDETIASFCSFCGASTVLTSRIQKTQRPKFLIPFKITKEQCKESYASIMKKAIFAPKELRSPEYIDSFRGIYMPYWTYYVRQDGPFTFTAEKNYRRGNYIYEEKYNLSGEINAYYKGLSYDASSSFDDNISECLAPYDVKGMKGFTPAYLSGFYADTADIDENLYKNEAIEEAYKASYEQVRNHGEFKGYTFDPVAGNLPSKLHTQVAESDYSMFPVWFMSYRNRDRVAYATVNGQTGKVVADIPIDAKKFTIGSLLIAAVIFFILCIGFPLMPYEAMGVVAALSVLSLFVYSRELKSIGERESRETDIGYIAKHHPDQLSNAYEKHGTAETKKSKIAKKTNSKNLIVIVFLFEFAVILLPNVVRGMTASGSGNGIGFGKLIIWAAIAILSLILCITSFKRFDKIPGTQGRAGIITALISIIIALGIRMVNPFYDWIYYVGIIVMLVGIFITLLDIMKAYNLLSTRRLPQFDHKGGDDRA